MTSTCAVTVAIARARANTGALSERRRSLDTGFERDRVMRASHRALSTPLAVAQVSKRVKIWLSTRTTARAGTRLQSSVKPTRSVLCVVCVGLVMMSQRVRAEEA